MRVLLTGNRGKIGRVVEAWLRSQGDEVVGFDIVDGFDVLDKKLHFRYSGLRSTQAGRP